MTKQDGTPVAWSEREITLEYATGNDKYPPAKYVTVKIPQRILTAGNQVVTSMNVGDTVKCRVAIGGKRLSNDRDNGHQKTWNQVILLEIKAMEVSPIQSMIGVGGKGPDMREKQVPNPNTASTKAPEDDDDLPF